MTPRKPKVTGSLLQRLSSSIIGFLEAIFYRHGEIISSWPLLVLCITTCLSLISACGYLNLTMEGLPEKLWIPMDSDYLETLEWQKENFQDKLRNEIVLYESSTNVLSPSSVQQMHRLRSEISRISITTKDGRKYSEEELCYRVPSLGGHTKDELLELQKEISGENDTQELIDWSLKINRETYCSFLKLLPTACLYLGILDMWPNNDTAINSLTEEDITHAINTVKESATYRYPLNFSEYLGGITFNDSGHIIGAKTALNVWTMENFVSTSSKNKNEHLAGTMISQASEQIYNWEAEFLTTVLNENNQTQEASILPQAVRSFGEISGETILGDVGLLVFGTILLCFYVFIMMGKCNCVESRPILTAMCMLSILLAMNLSFGLCSAVGLIYSPIHSLLPLLLMGLGVDDAFVIVQSFTNVAEAQQSLGYLPDIEERMGETLKRAGVAITVTSLTDFLAFAIGSSSKLPALKSFCIYAAVGILSLYLMQITFFVAAFTLDQLRLEASRNSCFWFIKHRNFEPNKCSQLDATKYFWKNIYSKWLLKQPVKILVIFITTFFTALCIWTAMSLKQEFNIILFIPKSSYLSQFLFRFEKYYPEMGDTGYVYFGPTNFPESLPDLKQIVKSLEESQYVLSVNSWYKPMVEYTFNDTQINLDSEKNISKQFFDAALGKFLFSSKGIRYMSDFQFNQSLECEGSAPNILASRISYKHIRMDDRDLQIEMMDEVKSLVTQAEFNGVTSVIAYPYATWESNKIIKQELIRNLSLALLAVFIMTTLLIANVLSSLLVLLSVACTLIDVMALMYWWNLTIDTVTCIHLVLCVGLSVDYSAHVAVHFLKVIGTRDIRVQKTLVEVGAPVFHGAFSTFLTFVLLSTSDSYVFESFFKIFFGVFVFGVYHGLVFLPVVLSYIGPDIYLSHKGMKAPKEVHSKAYETVYTFDQGQLNQEMIIIN